MHKWADWPGKSALSADHIEHPAAYHMLDVAAVAEVLLAPFAFSKPLTQALALLVALHDLGKISDSFRAMLRQGRMQRFRHWELTEVLLQRFDGDLALSLGGEVRRRHLLYAATAGHHGRPPKVNFGTVMLGARPTREMRTALAEIGSGLEPAQDLIKAFLDLWPEASLDELDFSRSVTLSWWLPGLCAVADWIGSSKTWFPAEPRALPLAQYLEQRRELALGAVRQAGLDSPNVLTGPLFDFPLRPMQVVAQTTPLPDGPNLIIIEEETGAGKTEAALLLAQRMIAEGKGRGLFFALPSMATADAMFARAVDCLGRMFVAPSLTLAHGRSRLSSTFKDVQASKVAPHDPETKNDDGPSCSEWLAHAPRRALLANVGVGTIDQALMGVLPVKHQAMRGFGLSSKILIIDEVHEMGEAYIAQELAKLLELHRGMGGSAILLTATLPLALRAKLLATYGAHADSAAYPALTVAGAGQVVNFASDDRVRKGPVQIKRLEGEAEAVALLAQSAAQGAACVWVRNSVDDAIAAQKALQEAGVSARLLHARFALQDRKRLEAEIAAVVGKDGQERAGFVLVGTQVLESSLDFDFDVMVSDIAPIAGLIQRAGRLWRHMDRRPAATRPVTAPILHILSPDPNDVQDAHWLRGTLGSGAFVYSLADIWRSAQVIFEKGEIRAPEGLRGLVEAVHGSDAQEVPPGLEGAEIESLGKEAAARTQAVHNIVDLSKGYRDQARGDDEVRYPTRLGEEPQLLLLARMGPGGLVPWAESEDPAEAWAMSEVAVRRGRLKSITLPDQEAPLIRAVTQDWPGWKQARYFICIVTEDGSICKGLRYSAESGLVFDSFG